jgi:NADPH-ferrihemoprotein reductase
LQHQTQKLTPPQKCKAELGDRFEMHVAFSRDGPEKVYVQHHMRAQAAQIDALRQQRAYFYVCGDAANMAREVTALLGDIIATQRGVPPARGEEIVKQMRNSNQYQEDVWS